MERKEDAWLAIKLDDSSIWEKRRREIESAFVVNVTCAGEII